MRIDKYALIVSVLVAFSGCAKDTPLKEGKRLLSEGRVDMGLAALERAAREDPDNLEIRAVLAREREAVAARLLLEAESTRISGDAQAAEQKYRHVLQLNP